MAMQRALLGPALCVCVGDRSSTHRGSPGRAVLLLRERFSAGLEGGRLAVPEGRWALPGPGPGPGRART